MIDITTYLARILSNPELEEKYDGNSSNSYSSILLQSWEQKDSVWSKAYTQRSDRGRNSWAWSVRRCRIQESVLHVCGSRVSRNLSPRCNVSLSWRHDGRSASRAYLSRTSRIHLFLKTWVQVIWTAFIIAINHAKRHQHILRWYYQSWCTKPHRDIHNPAWGSESRLVWHARHRLGCVLIRCVRSS